MFNKTSSTSVASTGDAMDICPNVSRKEISTASLDTPYASMVKTTDRAQSQAEAAFPDYLNCILSLGPNFLPVDRVRFRRGIPSGISVKTVHAERSGVPLVLEGVHEETEWEADVFCVQELLRDQGETPVETQLNETHKITTVRGWLTECAYCATAGCPLRQDTLNITCPSRWREWLGSDALPQEIIPCGPNDLLDCVPSQFLSIAPTCDIRLGNSVSYMDRSVTVQHHLMVSSEPRASIIWIIVPVSSADSLVQYCRLKGEELDLGKTRVSIEDLVHAKCQVYVTEQNFGDLLIVPPNCFHQALNTNGMTINIVWSRMTIAGIKFSLHSQLDIYRRVCRPESLRIKIVTFFATETLAAKLSAPESAFYMEEKDELALLLTFLKEVLVEEWSSECQKMPRAGLPWLFNHGGGVIGLAESASCLYDCSFCGASIFQSFFQCTGGCILPSKRNTLPLFCIGCVAEGRSCKCGQLMPMQCCNFQDLLNVYNLAASYLDILPINDMELSVSNHLHIFTAACKLISAPRTLHNSCGIKRKHAHHAPNELIACPSCHWGACFNHLLDIGVHSAEAILRTTNLTGGIEWHKFHCKHGDTSRFRYQLAMQTNPACLEDHIPEVRLCIIGSRYQGCKQEARHEGLKPGFYDNPDPKFFKTFPMKITKH